LNATNATNATNAVNATNVAGGTVAGNGAGLSNINATNITTGSLVAAQGGTGGNGTATGTGSNVLANGPTFTGIVALSNLTTIGNVTGTNALASWSNAGDIRASNIYGNGAGITNLTAANIVGTIATATNAVNATNATNVAGGTVSGIGSGLSNINATNITSGSLVAAQGGTGGNGTVTGTGSNVLANGPTFTGTVSCSNLTTIGNVTGTNALASWSNAGDIRASNIYGNGAGITNLTAANIVGTIANATNATNVAGGTVAGIGAGLSNINATNITSGSLVAAQGGTGGNGTATGTGSNVLANGPTFTGTVSCSNLTTIGNVSGTNALASWSNAGDIRASNIYGNGAGITNLNATNISTGALSKTLGGTGAIETTGSGNNVLSISPTLTGTITCSNIAASGTIGGSGPGLTSLNATNISTGALSKTLGGTGAIEITGSGNNVLSISPTLTGTITCSNIAASGTIGGSGPGLSNLNATNISTGALSKTLGGTGAIEITGTGLNVLSGSPFLTGLVTCSNLTATGTIGGSGPGLSNLNATNISTGTLAKALGGTGAIDTTGTGNNVLSGSPTFTGTVSCSILTTTGNVTGTNAAATWSNAGDIMGKNMTSTGALKANGTLEVTGACTFSNASINPLAIMGGVGGGLTVDDSDALTLSASNVSVLRNTRVQAVGAVAQWATTIKGTGNDVGLGIATDANGNVYVTGSYTSTTAITLNVATGLELPISTDAATSDAFIIKYNTTGVAQWATTIKATGNDTGCGIATDANGNVYVIGYYISTTAITLNVATGLELPISTGSSMDAFIIKYLGTNGAAQWATTIKGTGTEEGRGIATDSNGNVHVTGYYNSTTAISLNVATGLQLPISTGGTNDVFIIKYLGTTGVAQWATTIKGTGNDNGYGIATDANGNVYVTGQYASTTAITLNVATGLELPISTSAATTDAFIIKYLGTTGVAQWATTIKGAGTDVGRGIATDANGNVYVTGYYTSTMAIALNVATGLQLPISTGSSDAFIIKYLGTTGVAQWATTINGTDSDTCCGIATDANGNVYVTGRYASTTAITLNVATGLELPISTNAATIDAFIIKYLGTTGDAQWATTIKGTSTDIGWGIATDANGNVYVTGTHTSTTAITLNVATGLELPISTGSSPDAFIIKYLGTDTPIYTMISNPSTSNGFYKLLVNSSASLATVNVRDANNLTTLSTITITSKAVKALTWYGTEFFAI
jgi:hypothetical protein